MINFDQVKEYIKENGTKFGINKETGVLDSCGSVGCGVCMFQHGDCSANRGKWLTKEVVENEIPEDLAIDAPVWVSNAGQRWYRRYFAGKADNGQIQVYCNGATSWSGEEIETWEKATLAVIVND